MLKATLKKSEPRKKEQNIKKPLEVMEGYLLELIAWYLYIDYGVTLHWLGVSQKSRMSIQGIWGIFLKC